MQLTLLQLRQAVNCGPLTAAKYLAPLLATMAKYGINTPLRAAHFLAQIGHESISLTAATESLNYTPAKLLETFSRARITEADAKKYGRIDGVQAANQPEIANRVYGGIWGTRNLGNTLAGDGYKYRGRGPMQTTGRTNYRAAGKALGVDLEAYPERINEAQFYTDSAGFYWKERGLNALADLDSGKWSPADKANFVALTRRVNGGVNGLADREARYKAARKALGIPI